MRLISILIFTLALTSCAGPAKEEDYMTVSPTQPSQRTPESVAARMIDPAIR